MGYRELTRQEKTAIRKLVVQWCANYDRDTGFPAGRSSPGPGAGAGACPGGCCAGAEGVPPVWQVLCPQAAAALLLPDLSGRGQPQEVPRQDAEQARKRRVQVLRFKPPKAL